MDHAHHMAEAAAEAMPMRCKMNMLWNYDTLGICLVFPSLQITSTPSLVFYLFFLTSLSISSELLRVHLSTSDRQLRSSLRTQLGIGLPTPSAANANADRRASSPQPPRRASSAHLGVGDGNGSEEALLGGVRARGVVGGIMRLPWSVQGRRSVLYTLWVAISSYLMLILMSYNAYLISAVLVGAFAGHFLATRNFDLYAGAGDDDKISGVCH